MPVPIVCGTMGRRRKSAPDWRCSDELACLIPWQRSLLAPLVGRFVLVLLRNTATHAQSLEGSRFVARRLYGLAAGGSRERLELRQFYGPLYPRNPTEAMGKNLALRRYREPPASNR